MNGGSVLDRVVVVWGDGQGSGVLLDRRQVLTAWHVVADSRRVEVFHPTSSVPVMCTVGWADKEHDIAVLLADRDVISAARAAPMGRLRYGEAATDSPLPNCQIVGFPEVQRYGDRCEDLEYDQYRATVLPMAGRMRGRLVCELDRSAAEDRGDGTTPLAGLSGAPVFAGPVLLGVVTQVPQGRDHLRIEGAPIRSAADVSDGPFSRNSRPEKVTQVHPQDEHFEAEYARDLSSQYRRTEIFGIEELGRSEARWDLDTAYLSLRAESSSHAERPWAEPDWGVTRRIEELLARRPRVLLRGEAGAGKTTLVWWLAAHAASGTLGEQLTELNGLVPFVIPLREVHARGGFPSVAQLLSPSQTITGGPPDGWAARVLTAGRALLLVDGLDEVSAPQREEARRWLSDLLDRYPNTRCVATVRPNAVEEQWLEQDRFAELTLLPMSDDDIRAFVRAWHNAARLECDHFYDAGRRGEEQQLLTFLEGDLLHQLKRNTALGDLARTPLLCAVICALHRRRRGLMPTTRWSLYRAALSMLLGGRDAGRGVRHIDHIALEPDDQHTLLQRLAIWLVRTGQQQMTQGDAVHQLGLLVGDMPQVQEQGTPERILRFLLDRSGLLQERGDNAIQFIHRTFQDFLAAKEFHESGYLPELLHHALDEAWQDVLVLGVGHASRWDAERLIEHLIAFGDQAVSREQRCSLYVLAARCAVSLRQLSSGLTWALKSRVGALMPPLDTEVEDMAALGDWAVEVQPDSDGPVGSVTRSTVRLLALVRSDKARQKLRRYATHPDPQIRNEVARVWDAHPLEAYANEVLVGMRVPFLAVDQPEKLKRLSVFEAIAEISVSGSYPGVDLDACLPVDLKSLALRGNGLVRNLDFLRGRVGLTRLEVWDCQSLSDLSALLELNLSYLRLSSGAAVLPPHPGVRELILGAEYGHGLTDLKSWTYLEHLTLWGDRNVPEILRAALGAARLTRIELRVGSLDDLTSLDPNPRVQSLKISGLRNHTRIPELRRAFPHLTTLDLGLDGGGPEVLDLTDLQRLPDLELYVWGVLPGRSAILGTERFGDRIQLSNQ
ncbi:NACHT domain-containing protein [Streptomyces sp. NPDC056738]|uniref:NACHT domain-containing protein n=1 Tax=Streptomyces sp. NPDC056738 TaxID=3345933 RepID=UPI0036B079DB